MSKVTVIIANHNYGEYLESAIESALQQTYQNVNVAVCDDASTDHSEFVLKKYKKNPRVDLYYNKVRVGPSASRNSIISRHLDSDYFMILDSDDVMHPTKVEKLLNVANKHPLIGAVYADYDNLNPQNNLAVREYKPSFSREKLFKNCIVHSGSLINKNALLDVRLSDTEYYDNSMLVAEDFDLWLRISSKYTLVHLPEVLTLVRITPKNTTNSVPNEIWQTNWNKINDRIMSGYYK